MENLVLLKQKKYSNNKLLIITYIYPGSIAAKNKVMNVGNIIRKVNDKKVETIEDFKLALIKNTKFIKLQSLDNKILFLSNSEIIKEDKNLSLSYNFKLTKSYDTVKKNWNLNN